MGIPANIIGIMGKEPFDPDANLFLIAAGITDQTQKRAVHRLVIDLKRFGVWTKCLAIYPMVGGTSTTHMYNLKDPRNLDVAFRLSFSGGWTHSSTGALPNGTNAFANTFLNPNTLALSHNNFHLTYYSRTQAATATAIYEMGAGNSSNGGTSLWVRRNTNTAGHDVGLAVFSPSANRITLANTDGRGFYAGYGSGTTQYIQKNNNTPASRTFVAVSFLSANLYLGSFNEFNTSTIYYSNKECAFSSIGLGMTTAEVNNYYSAVQAFQTALSRQV